MSQRKRMFFKAAHRDKAERVIITAGRSVGATVVQLNGKDVPDLLVGYKGVTYLPEVKSRLLTEDKGRKPRIRTTKVSEGQKEFAEKWRGGPTGIIYEPADLLRMIGAPRVLDHAHDFRWLAENGFFLCESCWLPENGLHAKDCPTRKALKVPPKVQNAHRAAKKMDEAMPKRDDGYRSMQLGQQCSHPPGCPEMLATGHEFCPQHRPPRGVEGELQPLKVRIPPRAETCRCGHQFADHGDGGPCETNLFNPDLPPCLCPRFIERRQRAE